MVSRRGILFLISLVSIILIYNVPFYNLWVYRRIVAPDQNGDFFYQARHMDPELRRETRFGLSYPIYRDMVRDFDSSIAKDITILLPPNDYVHERHFEDMEIPEPAVFYYFTGINAVSQNSPKVHEANWALEVIPDHIYIKKIRTRQHLDSLLAQYKRYNN